MGIVSRIKECCNENGYSITQFEKLSGITENSSWRWDKNSPSVEKIIRAAKTLNVSIDYLCGLTDIKTPAANGDGLTDAQRELMAVVPQLPDSVASLLLSGAKDWLNNHTPLDDSE